MIFIIIKSGLAFDLIFMIMYKTKETGIVIAKAIRTFENISTTSKSINVQPAITNQPNILIPLSILGAEIIL